jgi:ABC-type polysaccharide/polyol phosphate transport system ATPase subunit
VSDAAIVVDGVSKRFRLYRDRTQSLKQAVLQRKRSHYDDFWALRDVSFEIPHGTTFGLIGENGSGKSTLLKCVARILRPDTGSITAQGRLAALLELGSGFHPELSGRENVYLNGSILGLSRRDIDRRLDEIIDFAGVEAFIDQPVKNYSSGMYVRLGFSVAINVDPDILLVDEVLAVGDSSFQQKCMEKFADYRASGRTVVVVSHAMGQLRTLCDHVAWLEHGELKGVGPAGSVVDDYVDETHRDRIATAEDGGGARWGSGEIRITRAELLDRDGSPTLTLRTGDPATFRLHYDAPTAVAKPVFGIGIATIEGHEITGPNTRDFDDGDVPDVLEGTGYVDLRVSRLMLLQGTFDLTVAVYDFTRQHPIDHRHRLLRFDVVAGEPREGVGVVSLGGEWRYSPSGLATGVPSPLPRAES